MLSLQDVSLETPVTPALLKEGRRQGLRPMPCMLGNIIQGAEMVKTTRLHRCSGQCMGALMLRTSGSLLVKEHALTASYVCCMYGYSVCGSLHQYCYGRCAK